MPVVWRRFCPSTQHTQRWFSIISCINTNVSVVNMESTSSNVPEGSRLTNKLLHVVRQQEHSSSEEQNNEVDPLKPAAVNNIRLGSFYRSACHQLITVYSLLGCVRLMHVVCRHSHTGAFICHSAWVIGLCKHSGKWKIIIIIMIIRRRRKYNKKKTIRQLMMKP